MKENGKLIELLNEYRTEKGERNLNEFEVSQTLDSLNYLRLFIKWLVDKDKIDNSKFYDKNILKGFMTLTKEEKADSIIMNLSIQDNPIEFLVSILK